MTKLDPVRRRFMAALALYLVWVGVLAAMAVATAKKPAARLFPPAAQGSADEPKSNP